LREFWPHGSIEQTSLLECFNARLMGSLSSSFVTPNGAIIQWLPKMEVQSQPGLPLPNTSLPLRVPFPMPTESFSWSFTWSSFKVKLKRQLWDFLEFFYIFSAVLEFELRAYTLSHSTSFSFFVICFWGGVSWTICPGWLQTTILLISASE
jgi:hypothetical protein